jgi:hypothetical protein
MKSFLNIIQLLVFLSIMISSMAARKTYKIKNMIDDKTLIVQSPRVRGTSDIAYCLMKDDNNDICVEVDLNWRVGSEVKQNYQEQSLGTVKPHVMIAFQYYT